MGLHLLRISAGLLLLPAAVWAQPMSRSEAAMFACIVGTVETAGAKEQFIDAETVLDHCTCRGVRDAHTAELIERCPDVVRLPRDEVARPWR